MIGKKVNHLGALFVVIVSLFVVVGLVVPAIQSQFAAHAIAASETINIERVVVAVEGMHCTSCASGIKSMLKRTPGVVSAEVNFERKEAVVEFKPADTSREKIVEAIKNLGFRASVKE